MRRDDICIYVSPANRARLEAIIVDRNSNAKAVWRARIVLATADGHGTNAIMRLTGKSKPCVWRWQERYIAEGVDGLMRDKTRPAGRKPLSRKVRLKVLAKTANKTPANTTHWSRASMAAEMGISPSSVGRIWAEAGLKPHLVRRFKVSNDPLFEEKVTDVVGLYLNPPDRALVLCVDEKSQIQALDRTQPGLPLKRGRAATMTHDYKRHGTTTLFAALDVKSGLVIGECQPRHRAKEFIRFLKRINRCVQRHLDIHLVLDNYGTHKTPEVKRWLGKHSRFHLHFTPTSASWLNLVERFFAEITHQAHPARRLQERCRPRGGHPRLSRPPQRRSQALRVDQERRGHSRQRATCSRHTRGHQSREPTVKLRALARVPWQRGAWSPRRSVRPHP